MKILIGYIKVRKKSITAYIFFCTVFAVSFYLYKLPLSAVCYSSALCFFAALIFSAADFRKYAKKHAQLEELKSSVIFSLNGLPEDESDLDRDYNEIIQILFDDKRRLVNEMNKKYSEMTDYYTIWVHQIKTPIFAMNLALGNEDDPLHREISENLQKIEQYADMSLCYLRLDSESTDFVIKSCFVDDIIKQAVRKFSMQFIRKKLRLDYRPSGCSVVTDEKWMLFVIEQVLSNSLKYTKQGFIAITFERSGILCIRDSGIGIAPEDMPRIFERGFTGYNGRSDKKASGIGLYLCRRICDNLGHKISAYAPEDGGTEIRIVFKSPDTIYE